MKVFYPKKSRPRIPMGLFVALVFLPCNYFLYFYMHAGLVRKNLNRSLVQMVVYLPVVLVLLKAAIPGTGAALAMDSCRNLYLLPNSYRSGMAGARKLLLETLERDGILPAEAREICSVVSVRKLGKHYWVRCVVRGRPLIYNMLLRGDYHNFPELLRALQDLQ